MREGHCGDAESRVGAHDRWTIKAVDAKMRPLGGKHTASKGANMTEKKRTWDRACDTYHRVWKLIARAAVAVGFGYAAWIGLEAADFRMALLGLLGLLLLGFWAYVEWIIKNRDISIGKEGFSITKPSKDPSPVADSGEARGGLDAFAGTVRDSFIHLGNRYYYMASSESTSFACPSESPNWLWTMAYEHYAAANRIKKSILTAFRCMQCLAHMGGNLDNLLMQYFEQALWHADGPREEVENRHVFAEWVRAHRTDLVDPRFASKLRTDLKNAKL